MSTDWQTVKSDDDASDTEVLRTLGPFPVKWTPLKCPQVWGWRGGP